MGKKRRRKTNTVAGLVGLACVAFLAWKYFSVKESPFADYTYTVKANVALTHTRESLFTGLHHLENLITFLHPGDELHVLESVGPAVRVVITKHNNFPTNLVGWVPKEYLEKYARTKKSSSSYNNHVSPASSD